MTETGRFAARPWTPADDEVLRSLALKGVDARGIGNRLNRTPDAVRSRARRLNILIRKHRGRAEDKEAMGKRSTWTSKDDDQLRALAASGESSAVIAVRLNRTAVGVRRRAMDASTSRRPSTTHSEVCDRLFVDEQTGISEA